MNDTAESKPNGSGECRGGGHCDCILAFLLLRGWLALRAILTGIEKFSAYRIDSKPLIDPVTGMEDPSGAMLDVKVKFYALTNNAG